MHDARTLIDARTQAIRRLARRGYSLDLTRVESLQALALKRTGAADELRVTAKQLADEVRRAAGAGEDVTEAKLRARQVKDEIRRLETERDQVRDELRELLFSIPNLPLDTSPDGDSGEFAVEVRRVGTPQTFSFEPKDHVTLGEELGILDISRGVKLSGPRFVVARGVGAALERALASLFLCLHTTRHGYVEFSVPFLVNRRTMTGTGQLPKFADDLFATAVAHRELFLIPTAEVPLTNLYADEIVPAGELPLALTAHTPCFRSEAGSYGRDTRGLIRLHQFSKVELVRICEVDQSVGEMEAMLTHAEACLKELGLVYRVVKLAAGDLGFAAQFTYDIEVWLPSQHRYREISSVSDCGTFQSRRANIRTRDSEGRRRPVATINGSGLPIGRTVAALLEQGQQQDGSVLLPEALHPYLGFRRISPEGKPVAGS
ncbi:serine--tRNA ligase [Nonomuraea sp. 10N515B]|uniref:serine--tRNA ligase n=1 Tax=Nonomuraea sp. 10N515B TaxID=3457422 RepID=UPI003FCCA5F5